MTFHLCTKCHNPGDQVNMEQYQIVETETDFKNMLSCWIGVVILFFSWKISSHMVHAAYVVQDRVINEITLSYLRILKEAMSMCVQI